MDLSEQPEMNPNQPYRAEAQPQYQSQYPYPPSTSAFSMDQDMNMSPDNFAATVQAHTASSLDNNASRQGSGQASSGVNVSGSASTAPGMEPPQSTNHAYSPNGARASIDETQDGGLSGGDPKRKRSKVSRACDECRRKKVRCDAAADDGTIKTCSNCARAGLICEYSRIPMKRGPSKGYIKELSERVQQVESLQMALSNTPGYRQSMDASGAIYAEQPFSPDDAMSLKRNFSFSADQRSPFVGPEYNRDRIPSVGGWISPHSSSFRTRDRGSIAVAPDQQPAHSTPFSKPFWTHETEGPPPAKRQKMDSGDVEKPALGQEFLSKYYREFHPYLPILPDADAALAIVDKATSRLQHAFVAAVQRLPSPKPKPTSEPASTEQRPITVQHVFKSRHDLDEFMWEATRQLPDLRSAEDNLVYIWIYLLLAVEAENDLTRLHDGLLPRKVLIKHACDLAWECVTALSRDISPGSDPSTHPPYVNDFARAWHCATVPARLHALAVGSSNPIPRYYHQYNQKHVPHLLDVLTRTGAIVALAAGQLTVVSCVVQDSLPPSQFGRHCDLHHRLTIQEGFDNNVGNRFFREGNETLVDQLRLFVDLTLSRCTENFHPFDIIAPATALAESLHKHFTASEIEFVYNPFLLHLFTLTVITLLEFLTEAYDTDLFKMAIAGIDDIKVALGQISERDHIGDEQQHNDAEVQDGEQLKPPVHWADALLKMIDGQVRTAMAANTNGASSQTRLGDGTNAATDFSQLLRHGYLTVLAQQVY